MPEQACSSSHIGAFVFDLDGTLVETERLKALSYARVIGTLTGTTVPDQRAIDLYELVIGSADEMVCDRMIEEFNLERALEAGSEAGWKALHRLRMEDYRLHDGATEHLLQHAYQHNIDLLRMQKSAGRSVAVATSSLTDEAERVIGALGLLMFVDEIVGRDAVSKPKPDPEIYLYTMDRLGITPDQTIIIEDSPIGTRAAIASGAAWICVTTPLSRKAIASTPWLDRQWVVDDPATLKDVVDRRLKSSDNNPQ
jgi:HAD superfamily hydrolase (TIGR01509 family)